MDDEAVDWKQACEEARDLARRFYRVADHLALMHRRENRVMEGGEGEIKRLCALGGKWIEEKD